MRATAQRALVLTSREWVARAWAASCEETTVPATPTSPAIAPWHSVTRNRAHGRTARRRTGALLGPMNKDARDQLRGLTH